MGEAVHMKIERYRDHYRMTLTPCEFEALSDLATRGEGEIHAMENHEWRELGRRFKQGFRKITGRGSWAVIDRRKKKT